MAEPAIVRGTYLDIAMGDGVTPTEGFDVICGLTTRSFTIQANTSDTFTRDCADPEDVPHRRLIVTGVQWDLSGDGLYNRAQAADIRAAVGVRKNYRFKVSEPAADGVEDGWFEGPGILTNVQLGGSDNEFGTISVQIASDGAWTWEAAA